MTLLNFPAIAPATTTRTPSKRLEHAGATATTTLGSNTLDQVRPPRATPTVPAQQHPAHAGPRAVPNGSEARGFVLYVGLDEATAAAGGTDLAHIVQALKQFTAGLAPAAQTHAAVALAPVGAGGRNVDVVRLALQEPVAVATHRTGPDLAAERTLVIDFSRKTLVLDDTPVTLTYTELELLEYLIRNEGRTVTRTELIHGLRGETVGPRPDDEPGPSQETPNERTIDVHVRRLRAKLGHYEQIVRTVRGAGYRFDQHPDVRVHFSSAHRVRSA